MRVIYGDQPASSCLLSFPDVLVKSLDETPGDRPGRARSDGSAVDLGDGDDLGTGSGEETLIGDVEIVSL